MVETTKSSLITDILNKNQIYQLTGGSIVEATFDGFTGGSTIGGSIMGGSTRAAFVLSTLSRAASSPSDYSSPGEDSSSLFISS